MVYIKLIKNYKFAQQFRQKKPPSWSKTEKCISINRGRRRNKKNEVGTASATATVTTAKTTITNE